MITLDGSDITQRWQILSLKTVQGHQIARVVNAEGRVGRVSLAHLRRVRPENWKASEELMNLLRGGAK